MKPHRTHDVFASLSLALSLAACGDTLDGGSTPAPRTLTGQAVKTGNLVGGTGDWPGGIGGVHYSSGGMDGYTDPTGAFSYVDGTPVIFSVADVEMQPTAGAALLSPWQLATTVGCHPSAELGRVLVLLQSLDQDGDLSNGIDLAPYPPGMPMRPIGTLGDPEIAALIAQLIPGRTVVPVADATNRFIAQMDGEVWSQLRVETFGPIASAQRSQGATTDGSFWYFSWRFGLQKTDFNYNILANNPLAIPPSIGITGSDHIGDIDYWNSTLFVPVEDSKAYKSPKIVKFDLNLQAGQIYALPNTLLTEGVPWVAVDGPRGNVYVAQWDPTPAILIFALSDLSFQRALPLSQTLGRIQGAKVLEGALYAAADDANKTIYKINLETGTVMELFALQLKTEQEGLVLLPRPDGSLMHTLNVAASGLAMEFRHHQRTRASLTSQTCM